MSPKFGIAIHTSDKPEDFVKSIKLAEKVGYSAIWIPDYKLYRDLYIQLALCAINTNNVTIGPSVTNPYTRHPAVTAAAIATLDELSGGRVTLGLAAGGLVLHWLGISRRDSRLACRESVDIIRRLIGGETVDFEGKVFKVHSAQLVLRPERKVPIFMGATGESMLQLSGEIADGAIMNVGANMECVKYAKEQVMKGVNKRSSGNRKIEVVSVLLGCVIDQDRKKALEAVKKQVAIVLGNTPQAYLKKMDLNVKKVMEVRKELYRKGDQEASRLISDGVAADFALAGTPRECVKKVEGLMDVGVNQFILNPERVGRNFMKTVESLGDNLVAAF